MAHFKLLSFRAFKKEISNSLCLRCNLSGTLYNSRSFSEQFPFRNTLMKFQLRSKFPYIPVLFQTFPSARIAFRHNSTLYESCTFSKQLQNFRKTSSSTRCCHKRAEEPSKSLLSISPSDFVEVLRSKKLTRCFFVWSDSEQRVIASHSDLKEIEDWLNNPSNPQYKQHEAIFLSLGMRTNCLLGAFLWNVNRGQACGGIRMTPFTSMESFICEGLRLSRRLGIKAALSGLWMSGGKGLISEPKDRQHIQPEFRQKIFYDYGDFVSSLNGCFVAGMDTGLNTFDLYNVHARTRWVVSGPEDIGGSGNAATLLGRGIICAVEAALDFLNAGDLNGKKIAVQGAGGIGLALVSSLLDQGVSHVYVTDTSKQRTCDLHDTMISRARGRLKVEKVQPADMSILSYDCDILALCAVGHVLTSDTIPYIRAKIVCGSANALLPTEDMASFFAERDVTYILEYLPNRMAFVISAYESYGRLYKDPVIERHFDKQWEHSIYCLTQKTLKMAAEKNINVIEAANQLAEEYNQQKHPLWPDRTKTIIQSLLAGQWHNGQDFWRKRTNFAKADVCSQS